MKKQNKGITLIALVITIIILLILAGISIASLTGSGLFEKAGEAKNKSVEAQEQENTTLREYEDTVNEYLENNPGGGSNLGEEIKNVDTSVTDPVSAMPDGTKEVIEGDANKGIVIKDSKDNEWTWVEVPKTIFTATESKQYDTIKADLINYVTTPTNYRDSKYEDEWYALDGSTLVNESTENLTETQKQLNNGCGLTYYEYKENYEKMLSGVFLNGGFWISRYEIGDATATLSNITRTETSGITGEAVSRVDQIPYNYITCSQSQILADRMKPDTNKTTSLLFGIQWDLTCKFIDEKEGSVITKGDCKEWGNYANSSLTLSRGKYNTELNKSTSIWKPFNEDTENYVKSGQTSSNTSYCQLLTTGASEQTNKMNIYNFASNQDEWTLEQCKFSSSIPCTLRGGNYALVGPDSSASMRTSYTTSDIFFVPVGPRATLY